MASVTRMAVVGAVAALVLTACPAAADVLQIGDDGAVAQRTGGGDVVWVGDVASTEEGPVLPDAAITGLDQPEAPAAWRAALAKASAAHDVSPSLLAALVWRESGWRVGAASARGAVGLAQLMPATARMLAVDARDPVSNLDGGARYLRLMLDRFDGDVERALAAYNAGPGRVARAGGVPRIAETQAYVSTILDRLGPVQPAGAVR